MKSRLTFGTFSALAVIGLGLLLAGCGDQATPGSTSSTGNQDAAQQFLADRGGNVTPGATGSGTAVPGTQGGAGRVPGLAGTITKVEGNNITITTLTDGSEATIQLSDTGKIYQQATVQVSDIKTGDTVTAIGTKTGDTLDAQVVQIGAGGFGGGFGGGGFGPGTGANPPPQGNGAGTGAFPSGTPPAGFGGNGPGGFGDPNASGTPGTARDFASGTVTSVDGNNITIKAADGSTSTFTVSSATRIQKRAEMQITDLKAGDTITAIGQANGTIFEATTIEISQGFTGQTSTP